MQSFCFEIKSTCKNCGNPVSINAFVEDIYCDSCNSKNEIREQNWKSIVSDNIKEARKFEEGEGQNSKTFTGEFEFSFLYGKQKARCSKCKTTIPGSVFDSFEGENYICSKCSNLISVRKPNEFNLKVLPAASYIVGEDTNQFNAKAEGIKKPDEIKPVLFNCPSCAANLEVDGSNRMITCKFCNSKVYLPDDLWHELHPVRTVNRWYIIADESNVKGNYLPEWYHLSDVTSDYEGNLYAAGADNESEQFMLWSMTPDMKLRWIRNDIKFEYEHAGITITKDNKILLWNSEKRSLSIFSGKDGSDLPGIKGEDATEANPYTFNLKGCHTLISDSDNTILAVINNTFVRFYNDGTRAPVWEKTEKGKQPGLFSRLFGGGSSEIKIPADDSEWAPGIKELGDTPKRTAGRYIKMNPGFDGFVYMLDTCSTDGVLAKYTREGKQLWKKVIPLDNWECKPCADKNGYVYILGSAENERKKLIRFSPDGDTIDVMLNDVVDGGLLSEEDNLAISPGGTIYALRYYEILKVFAPDMTCRFASDRAKEEDREKLEDYKEKKEAED